VYRCDECGFEDDMTQPLAVRQPIVDGADALAAILVEGADELRTRRGAAIWSPLEYGCHVRDVLLVQRERVLRARREDRPTFEPMGRDERVEHDGYVDQDPADVARQLRDSARLFVNVLGRMDESEWDAVVTYTYPTMSDRPLRWVAVHTRHEVEHHLGDVRRQL
jgi:hypothetical protein